MQHPERYSIRFYQELGKLFYAIAAVDSTIKQCEYDTLKEIVKAEWINIDDFEDDFQTDAAYQIEIVFDWLYKQEKCNAMFWYDEFIDFKETHPQMFNKTIKKLILKTANAIAAVFAGKNKSELIIIARLNLNFK